VTHRLGPDPRLRQPDRLRPTLHLDLLWRRASSGPSNQGPPELELAKLELQPTKKGRLHDGPGARRGARVKPRVLELFFQSSSLIMIDQWSVVNIFRTSSCLIWEIILILAPKSHISYPIVYGVHTYHMYIIYAGWTEYTSSYLHTPSSVENRYARSPMTKSHQASTLEAASPLSAMHL
jgi:hypothetical protein